MNGNVEGVYLYFWYCIKDILIQVCVEEITLFTSNCGTCTVLNERTAPVSKSEKAD